MKDDNTICKCSVCNSEFEFPFNLIKEPEITGLFRNRPGIGLDLRPIYDYDSLKNSIQRCPGCGYVSRTITDKTSVTVPFLHQDTYKRCDNIPFMSPLQEKYYRYSIICEADKKIEEGFYALLRAAWLCDDIEANKDDASTDYHWINEITLANEINARICRERAVPLVDELLRTGAKKQDTLLLIRADLLRRTGQFSRLINEYSEIKLNGKNNMRILRFQINAARQLIDDAFFWNGKTIIDKGGNSCGEIELYMGEPGIDYLI